MVAAAPQARAFFGQNEAARLSPSEHERITLALENRFSLLTLEPIRQQTVPLIITDAAALSIEPVKKQPFYYVVAVGDTLTTIAEHYGLHIASITLANPQLENSELIKVGDQLLIPEHDAPADELEKENNRRQKQFSTIAKAAIAAQPPASNEHAINNVSSQETGFITPIHYSYISQKFSRAHTGIDFVAPVGSSVKAASKGCVIEAATGWNGGYGTVIKIKHADGIVSLYAHLSKALVRVGTCVEAGQVIARSGNTGNSTGAHLHFEIRLNNAPINPLNYVH